MEEGVESYDTVSKNMHYKYEILERCFENIIQLNKMSEWKTLKDLGV